MDVNQALRRAENALRDFIGQTLRNTNGDNWEYNSGIDPTIVRKWEDNKRREQVKQRDGVVEPRLIYYADFADLTPILRNHWTSLFQPAFDVDLQTMEFWLAALRTVRNQEAHGREILDHQMYSALGASGELRTRLIRHRSKLETVDDYFPRLERVNDNLGNVWIAGQNPEVKTTEILHPGDVLTFNVTASDPQGVDPEYAVVSPFCSDLNWQTSKVLAIEITTVDIQKACQIEVYIRGTSGRHFANGMNWDDKVTFIYAALPLKK